MSVQVLTNQDTRPTLILGGKSLHKLVTLLQDASKTAVLAFGTLLGRIVTGAVSASAITGTGNGTLTALSTVEGSTVKPGAYTLTCTFAVTHGGVFKLTGPGGGIIADNLTMRAGAGLTTAFSVGGLNFTLTDGSTDFAAADAFTITVAAGSGKYVPLKVNGKDGAQRVAGIYIGDNIAAADLVAGDVANASILYAGNLCEIDGAKIPSDGDYASTLATVLPSGRTAREELALLGIYDVTTVSLSEAE